MEKLFCFFCGIFFALTFVESVLGIRSPHGSNVGFPSLTSRSRTKHAGHERARIVEGECFLMLGDRYIETVRDNSTSCFYRGTYYKRYSRWIDDDTCKTCGCIAPSIITCCHIELLPASLSERCVKDPAGRHSAVPRLGACIAPLVERDSIGRNQTKVACRNPRLRQTLTGKTWILDREDPKHFAIAVRTKKSNYKRHAVRMNEAETDTGRFLYKLMQESADIDALQEVLARQS